LIFGNRHRIYKGGAMIQEPLFNFYSPIYTKDELIGKLLKITSLGWIPNARPGNVGGVGNTLEDLLGITENNLPIPNSAEWELKAQRSKTTSLTTLFHSEPSPTALRFVPSILLPNYGWPHSQAGLIYPQGEMSFRQTINGVVKSDRGFFVIINRKELKVEVSFDSKAVSSHHSSWLEHVSTHSGLGDLNPRPYWGFEDLFHKAGTKLKNTFYVLADSKRENGKEFLHYRKILKLSSFSLEGFLKAIESGKIYIDFDARTGHNHGTKFRLKQNCFPLLYESVEEIN
jgi:hypothetical protein